VAEEWLLRLRWWSPPLVHVLCVARRRWWGTGLSLQTYREAVRDAVTDMRQAELVTAMRMANEVGQRLQSAGMPVQVWARHGDPASEIVAVIRSEQPDLAVVSPGGRRGPLIPRPTVAEQVVRRGEVATLLVRGSAAGGAALPQEIAVAVTQEQLAEHALRWLGTAGWLSESRLTLIGLEAHAPSATGHASAAGSDSGGAVSETTLGRLVAVAASHTRHGAIDSRLLRADPSSDALVGALEARSPDLIVVPHPRPGQRHDLAEIVASAASASVLVLPVRVGESPAP
jgi:nucleotide-binding universal stress UspA family protein